MSDLPDRVYVSPTDDQLAEFIAAYVFGPGRTRHDISAARVTMRSRELRSLWLARHRAAQEAAWALEDSTAGGDE